MPLYTYQLIDLSQLSDLARRVTVMARCGGRAVSTVVVLLLLYVVGICLQALFGPKTIEFYVGIALSVVATVMALIVILTRLYQKGKGLACCVRSWPWCLETVFYDQQASFRRRRLEELRAALTLYSVDLRPVPPSNERSGTNTAGSEYSLHADLRRLERELHYFVQDYNDMASGEQETDSMLSTDIQLIRKYLNEVCDWIEGLSEPKREDLTNIRQQLTDVKRRILRERHRTGGATYIGSAEESQSTTPDSQLVALPTSPPPYEDCVGIRVSPDLINPEYDNDAPPSYADAIALHI